MTEVREHLCVFPYTETPRVIRRDEALLLTPAVPGPAGALWGETAHIDVVHFDQPYKHEPFSPPRYLYEGLHGRIEWQQMDFRQPFYHRNLDVDELSYQIAGDRTLMTEFGTAELIPGDLVRIPAGVAHDNWGRQESHILWYLPEPCNEALPPTRESLPLIPPFDGWEPQIVNELVTDCMGNAGGHDTAAQRSDERLILGYALEHPERLSVVHPSEMSTTGPTGPNVQWIWNGANARVGYVSSKPSAGLDYIRHRNADEIQYQVSGRRLLVTQSGSVEVGPGDFVRIPVGVAFTSIHSEDVRYITTVSYHRLPRVHDASRGSETLSAAELDEQRAEILASIV